VQLLDLLFPKTCLGCGRYGKYICKECISDLEVKQRCIVCQRPAIDGYTHPYCKGKYTIDRAIALYPYRSVVGKAIRSLKYKFATDIAKELVEYSVQAIHNKNIIFCHSGRDPESASVPILTPIPMHWKRKNWRGFNQTEVLGEQISKKLGLKYEPHVLHRIKQPKAQEGLKKEERQSNVSNVFSLNSQAKLLTTNCYILFDDVLTTGSTLSEAGKVLKKAGAKKVWAVTIAR
jgi:competence protein ComFC